LCIEAKSSKNQSPKKGPRPGPLGADGGYLKPTGALSHFNKFLLFDKFDSKSDNIKIFIFLISSTVEFDCRTYQKIKILMLSELMSNLSKSKNLLR
jgi:hypothetical protein